MVNIRNRKAQVAIWVILAIILVASILLFFTLYRGPTLFRPPEPGPLDVESFVEECVQKYTTDAVKIMLPRGGFLDPRNYKEFDNTKVEYICENVLSYDPCINQHPVLLKEMKEEIYGYLVPNVPDCFEDLKREIEKRRGVVTYGSQDIEVSMGEDRINVKVKRSVAVTRGEDKRTFDEFNVAVVSPAYNLASIALEIAAQEAKYCAFDPAGYSLTYPRYYIRKYALPESSEIYVINDTRTSQYMMTAVRSCAIPPGL